MVDPVIRCASCQGVLESSAQFCPHCGVRVAEALQRIQTGSRLDLDWGQAVVGEVIGEGGMGVVYRGWLYYNPARSRAGSPPHPVAIKVLHPALRGRERVRQLFLGEATALARLSHPNIVHFFALATPGEQLAIVIELVEGQPLDAIIARHRGDRPCLPFVRAWHYFSQLLGALAAIHALGIVHRDVKPSNLLIRHDGVAKLTDFGIARLPTDVRNTGSAAPGTGAYMAPEQVVGAPIDPRADLYSAAIVLYEMLTGLTPFDADDRSEILVRAAQVEEIAPPVAQHLPFAPPVLDELLARALAKDPAQRFASALEMGEAFRQGLGVPDHSGWAAQQKLARNAQAISSFGERIPTQADRVDPRQAAKLRTAVIEAYRQ